MSSSVPGGTDRPSISAAELAARFDAPSPLTVGLEEEVMVLDPDTLDLVPRAAEVVGRAPGDGRLKRELPAAQLEVVTPPATTVGEAAAELAAGRRAADSAAGGLRLACAGAHPFADPVGVLSGGSRYVSLHDEYASVAERQILFALQVHVAVRGADRALAVHDALRSYLPELGALAANAPFHAGRDTGLASIRPTIAETLPRQGVPPPLRSWEAFAQALAFGERSGRFAEHAQWWWELRPHPRHGTLEIRVPDAQVTVADAAAVAAVVHALVAHLSDRCDADDPLPVHPTWRIAENRWSACRFGLHGTLADLDTGEPVSTRIRLESLLEELEPVAERLRCAAELEHARGLTRRNGADFQRELCAREGGDLRALTEQLADRFTA